jgi:hypothetical protein
VFCGGFDPIAVMSVFNRQERKTSSGIFGVRLISLMQACAVEGRTSLRVATPSGSLAVMRVEVKG